MQPSVIVYGIKCIKKLTFSQSTEQSITNIKQFKVTIPFYTLKCAFGICMIAFFKGIIECLNFICVVIVACKTIESK